MESQLRSLNQTQSKILEGNVMLYKKIIQIRVVCFENSGLKKVKAKFCVDLAPFLQHTLSLVD